MGRLQLLDVAGTGAGPQAGSGGHMGGCQNYGPFWGALRS